MSDFQQQYALWGESLTVWPATRLATMTPDEYTQVRSKDSLTYWIESRLKALQTELIAPSERIFSTEEITNV